MVDGKTIIFSEGHIQTENEPLTKNK